MKAHVRPEHHLLAVEHEHDLHCMFELVVPPVEGEVARPPLHLALVVDRSGSMSGAKLDHARRCAAWLGERLRPTDELALIAYDDKVRLLLPRGPVSAAPLAAALDSIRPGGTTNLSGGWLKGLEQLRSAPPASARKILLLTDGIANVGITDRGAIAQLARSAQAEGIGTSTIGFGEDFDEDLLTGVADAGGGNAHWAETPDAAPGIFAREFDGLTRLSAQNVSVEIIPSPHVELLGVLNEYPSVAVPGGVQVQLGDAYGGETRRVVFKLHIPHLELLGPVPVAQIVLRYVSVGDEIAAHEVWVPVVVNAVSAKEAAAIAADAEVREQVLVLRAARARDEAVSLTEAGDPAAARHLLRTAAADLRAAGVLAPDMAAALADQATRLDDEAADLSRGSMSAHQRKRLRYDSNARRRGRP
jgi:Ca-activated chloride channel family protein